jgi:hypothetical protein
MADNKLKREAETREATERPKQWLPPEMLASPAPEEGYTFRWVRVSNRGITDATNVSSKLREGWEPVKASDYPNIVLVETENERFRDNVVQGGLLLCKVPKELVEQRNDYYAKQANSQMASVDNNLMRESDPRMPIFNDRKSKITFGNGN